MIVGTIQRSALAHIRVDALLPSAWRVCDTREASNDASSLIGFIQEHDGDYEVMRFGDPIEFTLTHSLDEALTHLTDATGAADAGDRHRLATVTEIARARAAS
jgi:hypothetical protein